MEKVYINVGILFCLILYVKSYPVRNPTDSVNYLTRFGYMKPEVKEAVELQLANAKSKVREGLKNFQFFAGIPRTGVLDQITVRAMNFPRCGNSELDAQRKLQRQKRFVLDSRWEKLFLTYKIINVPTTGPNLTVIEATVRKAFSFWANEANIHVQPTKNAIEKADIEISFVRGPHNDGIQFDEVEGVGRVIAHAWKPFNAETLRGDMHFNDEVTWTIGSDAEGLGFDFFRTAIHEAGHALGLEHSPHPEAMMYFAVTGKDEPKLSKDDTAGIQELYGKKLASVSSSSGLDPKIDWKKPSGGGGNRPIIVPSGTPSQSVPWECYRLQEENPKDMKGIRSCYQDFYRDFYLSQG